MSKQRNGCEQNSNSSESQQFSAQVMREINAARKKNEKDKKLLQSVELAPSSS